MGKYQQPMVDWFYLLADQNKPPETLAKSAQFIWLVWVLTTAHVVSLIFGIRYQPSHNFTTSKL